MLFVFVCFLDSYCRPCSMLDKLKHDLFLAAIGIESYNKATRWHTYWCSTPPRSVISCLLTQKICFPFWRGFPCDQYIYTMNWTVTKNQAQHSTQHIYFFSYPSVALLHQFSWIHHRRYCQANLLSKWSELISESEPAAPISLVGESECRRREGFDADRRDLSSQSRGYLVTWYILEMG